MQGFTPPPKTFLELWREPAPKRKRVNFFLFSNENGPIKGGKNFFNPQWGTFGLGGIQKFSGVFWKFLSPTKKQKPIRGFLFGGLLVVQKGAPQREK